MGLFSSSTKTYVGTTITRVIEDKKYIPSTLSGTIKAIFAKPTPGSIPDYVMEDLINSIGLTHKRYYKQGRDHYLYGLPIGKGVTSNFGSELVKPILEQQEGQSIGIVYNFFGPYNYIHQAMWVLDNLYQYNFQTREIPGLTAAKNGQTCYLDGITLVMSQDMYDALAPDSLISRMSNFIAIEPTVDRQSGNQIKAYYSYHYMTPIQENEGGGFGGRIDEVVEVNDIHDGNYNRDAIWFHTAYKLANEAQWKFWAYRIGSGIHYTLDHALDIPPQVGGTYMPWTYFRFAKVRGNEDKTTEWYKQSKKLLKKINMDYDTICDAVHENPDIADVEQAMMWWAVEADSTDQQDREYLYRYFDKRFNEMGGQPYDLNHEDLTPNQVGALINNAAMVIQDNRFKMALSHQGMFRRVYAGSIGPVDSYSSGELLLGVEYVATQTNEGGDVSYITSYPLPSHYYRKQISEGWYEEIMIFGMEMKYFIYGDYNTTGDGDDDDTRTDLLQIPVDIELCKDMSLLQKEKFFSRTMQFIFNSRVTVKIKWYQSTFFSFFIIIVAFAIMIYTGAFTGLDSFIAGAAAMTGAQLVTTIAITGLQYLAVSFAFKLFVKVVGVKIAFLVAIIALAAGVAVNVEGGLGGSFLKNALPNAQDLLKVGTNLSKAVNAEMAGDMAEMGKQMELLKSEAARLDKELTAAADVLFEDSKLTPYIVPHEIPEDFFNRTVHSGNIGMISIDAVGNYVDRMLTLPTLYDTIGELS
jgi:hypothetical protein